MTVLKYIFLDTKRKKKKCEAFRTELIVYTLNFITLSCMLYLFQFTLTSLEEQFKIHKFPQHNLPLANCILHVSTTKFCQKYTMPLSHPSYLIRPERSHRDMTYDRVQSCTRL
jgi:hypothetical protein